MPWLISDNIFIYIENGKKISNIKKLKGSYVFDLQKKLGYRFDSDGGENFQIGNIIFRGIKTGYVEKVKEFYDRKILKLLEIKWNGYLENIHIGGVGDFRELLDDFSKEVANIYFGFRENRNGELELFGSIVFREKSNDINRLDLEKLVNLLSKEYNDKMVSAVSINNSMSGVYYAIRFSKFEGFDYILYFKAENFKSILELLEKTESFYQLGQIVHLFYKEDECKFYREKYED